MNWVVSYRQEAQEDLLRLDNPQRKLVLKNIRKVSQNPLPQTEGGYGKPLGNTNSAKLSGLLKIKLKTSGLRVVYQLERSEGIMKIVVISVRDDGTVYKPAHKRING